MCHVQFFIALLALCETSEMFLTLQKNSKYLSCNVCLWICCKFSWFYWQNCLCLLDTFTKLRKATSSCLSVRPHGTTRLPLDGFSWNLIFEYFSKIFLENLRFVQLWQGKRALYKKICVHSWFRPEFFLEWVMFQTEIAEKIKTHILYLVTFSSLKSCRLWNNVEKYGTVGQATDGNTMQRMRIACWIPKATNTRSEYAIRIPVPRQIWLCKRASMLHYT
jgi:hypothetical protein